MYCSEAARIAKAFKRGRTSDVESLSDAMNLSPRAVRQLVESLEEANLIHVAAEERHGGYTLSRPADQITVRELMDAVAKLLPRPKGERSTKDPAWRFVQQLHKAKEDLAKSKTLADLAK